MHRPQTEEHLEVLTRLKNALGFDSLEHYVEWSQWAIEGMRQFGCGHYQYLGEALQHATISQAIKLCGLYFHDFENYALAAKIARAKRLAEAGITTEETSPRS